MTVYCTALTCIYMRNGICNNKNIYLEDFEYYKSIESIEKDDISDDMRCISYTYDTNWSKKDEFKKRN